MLERPDRRFGVLEVAIGIAALVMIVAGLIAVRYMIQQGQREEVRDRVAKQERAKTTQIATDLRRLLDSRSAATKAAIDELIRRFEEIQKQQTQIIIREQQQRTVVVVVTPSPQPTQTVYQPCQINPVNGRCLREKPK